MRLTIRLLIAPRGVPDVYGDVWNLDGVALGISEWMGKGKPVVLNFDPQRSVGKLRRVDLDKEGLWGEFESHVADIDENWWLAPAVSTEAATGSGRWDGEGEVLMMSLLPPANAVFPRRKGLW